MRRTKIHRTIHYQNRGDYEWSLIKKLYDLVASNKAVSAGTSVSQLGGVAYPGTGFFPVLMNRDPVLGKIRD